MAVQKSRVPRSRRGMRRAHDSLDNPTLSITPTGETHRRHHISPEGNYKGRRVLNHSVMVEEESNEE